MISDPENPAGQPQQINNGLMDLVLLVNLGGIGKAFEDSRPRSGVPNVTGSLGSPSLTPVTGPVKMWRRLAPALNQQTSGDAAVVGPPLIHGRAFVYETTPMRRMADGTLSPDGRQTQTCTKSNPLPPLQPRSHPPVPLLPVPCHDASP